MDVTNIKFKRDIILRNCRICGKTDSSRTEGLRSVKNPGSPLVLTIRLIGEVGVEEIDRTSWVLCYTKTELVGAPVYGPFIPGVDIECRMTLINLIG